MHAVDMEPIESSELADFGQLLFLASVDEPSCDSQNLLRGLDILLTCLADGGGKQKQKTKQDTKHRTSLLARPKPRDVMANPVFARLVAKKQRKICGYIFKADEVAYSCRDCQHDSTCVMCQACFADSNHDGHDVSFQRTSAGGCCDCGDPEAWAKTGFCSKHPGRDETKKNSFDLPKNMMSMAQPLIEVVVQYLFDALLSAEHSIRVSESLTQLGKVLNADTLNEWKQDKINGDDEGESSSRVEGKSFQRYEVRLHSDDIHPFTDVVKALKSHLDVSKSKALMIANQSDHDGITTLANTTLKHAASMAIDLEGFTTSIIPHGLFDPKRIHSLLEWLRTLCEISDSLATIVSNSIELQRYPSPSHTSQLLNQSKLMTSNQTIGQFIKTFNVSSDAVDFLSSTLPLQMKLSKWAKAIPRKFRGSNAMNHHLPGCLGDVLQLVTTNQTNDPNDCETIATNYRIIESNKLCLLDVLVRNYCLLNKPAVHQVNLFFHELILNQSLKHAMMSAFVNAYSINTNCYLKGLGSTSDSIFEFATQLLTVPSLLSKYPKTLVTILLQALWVVLDSGLGDRVKEDGSTCRVFKPDNPSISHSKYKHAADHLEFVLCHGNPTDLLESKENFTTWLHCLGVLQFADAQIRRNRQEPHVEYESDTWFATFNLGIKLHALFPLLLQGLSPSAADTNVSTLIQYVFDEIQTHTQSSLSIVEKSIRPLASNDTLLDGTEAIVMLLDENVPRMASSLHIPLHRFVSAMLKQVLVIAKDSFDMATWKSLFGFDDLSIQHVVLLMDAPIKCLAMSAQIQANLWRRNGDENMVTQLFNYCAMPYCVNFRDADLFLLQVGVLLLGAEHIVTLLIDRFDLTSFFDGTSSYLSMDKEQELQMVEEFLRLLLVLTTNVPSHTGTEYEDEFLRGELLHQLLVNPSTFSELSDNVSLPLGGQDLTAPISRLEPLLEQVASFQAPVGLEPGKYTIRSTCIDQCNPYHIHMNRELHESSREKILERPNACPPFVPKGTPLAHLVGIQSLLHTPSTVHILSHIFKLWHEKDPSKRPSEALLSTALDVLVFGVQMANQDDLYWEEVTILMPLLAELESGVERDQKSSVSWLLKEFPKRSNACAKILAKPASESTSTPKVDHEMDLQARKNEAKARAMAAMAKQMAAFSQMIEDDDDEDDDMGQSVENTSKTSGKRSRASIGSENETKKKWKPTCMLCHDSNSSDELCMVAMVQQSTVLSSGFRPAPDDALNPVKGQQVRQNIQELIKGMQLQSHGDDSPTNFIDAAMNSRESITSRTLGDLFWELAQDELEDEHHEGEDHDHGLTGSDAEGIDDVFANVRQLPRGVQEDEVINAIQEAFRIMPNRNRRQFRYNVRNMRSSPRSQSQTPIQPRDGLNLVPVGLFVRSCQHIVHMNCVDTYITTLHEKALRGEEFDGMQAVDPDAPMTQFLCPMCKTLCNVLIPMIEPKCIDSHASTSTWSDIIATPGTWIQTLHQSHDDQETLDTWKEYYEDALWEPHGSFEKGAPYLWSACAFTVAATLAEADTVEPGFTQWPASLEKEYASMQALVGFTRWSFAMVHLTGDSKVIYETVKRCCPIIQESKREFRKYTKMIGSLDPCIRGTVLGLLVADTFTAFMVTMVAAKSEEVVGRLIPVFSAADMLQRLGRAFFVSEPQQAVSFYQEIFKEDEQDTLTRMQTRTRATAAASVDPLVTHNKQLTKLKRMLAKSTSSKNAGALQLVVRMCEVDPTLRLKALIDPTPVLELIQQYNALLVRRMELVFQCLTSKDSTLPIPPPTFRQVSEAELSTLQQLWEWCVIRKSSQADLGAVSKDATNRCEHAEHSSEAYLANMFILRDSPRHTTNSMELVALPAQYDDLYSHHVNMVCQRCNRVPREPGICLVCGTLLCCGESCCSYKHIRNNPMMGECTRHAFECGGGLGIVLMLQQCRIVLIAGSMTAYFPCPYVDSHGEEDPGLQRGRPLKLDTNRYELLQSLWRSHRLYGEVSRLRNQRENEQPMNHAYF